MMKPLRVNRRRLVIVLATVAVALCLVSLCINLAGLALPSQEIPFDQILDVAVDGNIPTYFSTLLLALAALLWWTIGAWVAVGDSRGARPWKALALIFLYLSADEAAQLHECARRVPASWLPDWGVLHWLWVIFGATAVIVIGLCFARFLTGLPGSTQRLVLLAGAVYVTGALGLELIGASLVHAQSAGLALALEETAEEMMEMLGVILLIHALLLYIDSHVGSVLIRVDAGRPATTGAVPEAPAKDEVYAASGR